MYNFSVPGQRGTLFWHAHFSWLRATVYGPIVILPKRGVPYPFPKPYKAVNIIFGNINLDFMIYNYIYMNIKILRSEYSNEILFKL